MRFHPESPVACDIVASLDRLWIDGVGETRVVSFAPHGTSWLLRVTGVRRVDDAKRLVNASVRSLDASTGSGGSSAQRIARTSVSDPRAVEGYDVTVDGRRVGTVQSILGPALHAVALVATDRGDILIPLTAPYVAIEGTVVSIVDPPEGLLEPT